MKSITKISGILLILFLLIPACSSDDNPSDPAGAGDTVDDYLKSLPAWNEFSPLLPASDGETGNPESEVEWVDGELYVCA